MSKLKVHVSTHPLVAHKLSILRSKDIKPHQVRELVKEIGMLLAHEASADIPLTNVGTGESPLAPYEAVQIADKVAIVPVFRAGLGLVDPLLQLFPAAQVHYIGLYRDKATLQPVEYYNKLPTECTATLGIVIDPMIATSGTAVATINMLKDWGLTNIKFIAILASKVGIEALCKAHPDVSVYVGAIDRVLDKNGFIQPGLGDAGDRLFNTMGDGHY